MPSENERGLASERLAGTDWYRSALEWSGGTDEVTGVCTFLRGWCGD